MRSASGEDWRVAGRHASGRGRSGGRGDRCTGSVRRRRRRMPGAGRAPPAAIGLLHEPRLGGGQAAADAEHLDVHLHLAGLAADRKVALHVRGSGWPWPDRPSPSAWVASAMRMPPLRACPIDQPSPTWARPTAIEPDAVAGPRVPRDRERVVELRHGSLRFVGRALPGRPYGEVMREGIHWPTAVVVVGHDAPALAGGVAATPQPPAWLPVRGRPGDLRHAAHGIPRVAAPRRRPDSRRRGTARAAPAVHPRRPCRVPGRHRQRAVVDGHR